METKGGLKRDFDPELSPGHQKNREAAQRRNLRFVPGRGYVDPDGFLALDEFGQPL